MVLEVSELPVPQLLGLRHLSGGQHKRLCTNCVKLEPSEVTSIAELIHANLPSPPNPNPNPNQVKFIAELLHTNPLLEALELNGSLIVADSDPQAEAEELGWKLNPLLEALG